MKYLVPVLAGLALTACDLETLQTSTSSEPFTPDVSVENIEAHIRFLASDYMGGRDAGSDGYEIAANYVASQMRLLGLEPAGDGENSYFAAVPMQDMRADGEYNQLTINGQTYAQGDGVVIWANPIHGEAEITGELVFAGYGVSAANRGHDDYADLDVEGKIVVTMNGVPEGFPSEERAHHNSGNTKRAVAASRGAIGMITVNSMTNEQAAGWASGFATREFTALTAETGASPFDNIQVHATVGSALGTAFFDGAEMSLEEVRAAMSADEPSYPVFDLPHSVTLRQRTVSESFADPNVVGMIRGTDPELADEYVVLTAHLDHIGQVSEFMRGSGGCRSNDEQDGICNGAVDNASGISIMLETARTFLQQGAPRRSILFVALAAEEKGLLGSEHFARNPTVPADSMVANVNLDMPVIVYDFADVVAFGSDHSNLGPIARCSPHGYRRQRRPDPGAVTVCPLRPLQLRPRRRAFALPDDRFCLARSALGWRGRLYGLPQYLLSPPDRPARR